MKALPFVEFCERLLRVQLTPAQRVAALVAIDGVEPQDLSGEDRELANRLFGNVDTIPARARSVVLLLKGARIGGSYIFGGLYSLWRALTANLSTLAPGEQASAMVVAPDTRLGRQVLRYALGAAKGDPNIARLIEAETSDSFTLRRPDGRAVAIEVLPATRGGSALRGRSLVSFVMTEAAFFRDEGAVVNDQELFRAGGPRVLPGGLTIIETTAWAEAGLAYELFRVNFGTPSTCVAVHAPTLLMRPDAQTALVVERETARDPDNAAREFGAVFMPYGSGLFFDGHSIDRALAAGAEVEVVKPRLGHAAVGGDLGLVRDASGFVAVHAFEEIYSVAEVLEIRPQRGVPLKLSNVVPRGFEFAARHGKQLIHVDHHILEPAREYQPEDCHLEPVEGGQDAKVERYTIVRNLLNEGRIRIPRAYTRLANQLREVISKPMPGGGLQITLPRRAGVHGDVGASFVIAVHAATLGGGLGLEPMPEHHPAYDESRWHDFGGQGYG